MIASGGVGNLDHLVEGVEQGGADAVLAASIFHFGEYTVGQAKARLAERGIAVRGARASGSDASGSGASGSGDGGSARKRDGGERMTTRPTTGSMPSPGTSAGSSRS